MQMKAPPAPTPTRPMKAPPPQAWAGPAVAPVPQPRPPAPPVPVESREPPQPAEPPPAELLAKAKRAPPPAPSAAPPLPPAPAPSGTPQPSEAERRQYAANFAAWRRNLAELAPAPPLVEPQSLETPPPPQVPPPPLPPRAEPLAEHAPAESTRPLAEPSQLPLSPLPKATLLVEPMVPMPHTAQGSAGTTCVNSFANEMAQLLAEGLPAEYTWTRLFIAVCWAANSDEVGGSFEIEWERAGLPREALHAVRACLSRFGAGDPWATRALLRRRHNMCKYLQLWGWIPRPAVEDLMESSGAADIVKQEVQAAAARQAIQVAATHAVLDSGPDPPTSASATHVVPEAEWDDQADPWAAVPASAAEDLLPAGARQPEPGAMLEWLRPPTRS